MDMVNLIRYGIAIEEVGMSSEFVEKCVGIALESDKKVSADELIFQLGSSATRLGLVLNTERSEKILIPMTTSRRAGKGSGDFRDYPDERKEISEKEATDTGKKIWEEIKIKAKDVVCTDDVKNYVTGSDLKTALSTIILALLPLLSVPAVLLVPIEILLVSIIMLLLKEGLNAYCEW